MASVTQHERMQELIRAHVSVSCFASQKLEGMEAVDTLPRSNHKDNTPAVVCNEPSELFRNEDFGTFPGRCKCSAIAGINLPNRVEKSKVAFCSPLKRFSSNTFPELSSEAE